MIKRFFLVSLLMSSVHVNAELIKLECKTQNSDRNLSFNLLLGLETQKAIQVFRKGQLTMDLKVSEKFYELGQYTDALKSDFITVIKLDNQSLEVIYTKYMELVEPIFCSEV